MEVAEEFGDCTIVCVDSMCVYRGMEIGTASPTRADRERVPHELVDLVDHGTEFSVQRCQREAKAAIDRAAASGRQALLVGGTGLYHRAVIDDFEIPGQYEEVAEALRERFLEVGPEGLFKELEALDPLAASRMEPPNSRRIIRALEVTIGAKRPFSSFGPGLPAYPDTGITQVGINFDRTFSDAAITARVDAMVAAGFIDEVAALLATGIPFSRTSAQAVGYPQFVSYLEGSCSIDEAKSATVAATRQLARRQWAWFRRDPRITWYERSEIARGLAEALRMNRRSARD